MEVVGLEAWQKPKSIIDIPAEIIFRIFSYCNIFDICAISSTCKTLHEYAESHYVWKQKWEILKLKSKLIFPTLNPADGIEYKHLCVRIWKICFQKQALPRCYHCKQVTCKETCLEEWDRKVVIDIGSKISWVLSTTFGMRRHPSVVAIPTRKEFGDNNESNSKCCCHCGHRHVKPVCILCHPEKTDLVFVDWKMKQNGCSLADCVYGTEWNANLPLHKCMDNLSMKDDDLFASKPRELNLWNDVMSYLFGDVSGWEMISPLDCFVDEQSDLVVLHFYLKHLLELFKMLEEVRKPAVSLVLCEPVTCTALMRRRIANLLFDKLQVNRICFLNKALSISKLMNLPTCLVVDSGANNTVVTIIKDWRQFGPSRHVPVGGIAISQHLAEAIDMNGLLNNVALSSLDTSRVKSSCHLVYNFAAEERRKTPTPKQSVFVRSGSDTDGSRSKLHRVDLGAELYLAPETMYTATGLPELIHGLIDPLPEEVARDVLSNIILTGGNTELRGFANRLTKDLRQLMPKYSTIINTPSFTGCRSCDVAMGGTRVQVPAYGSDEWNEDGHPVWITREMYIVHGVECLP